MANIKSNSNIELLRISKLKDAQVMEDENQRNTAFGLRSVFYGQELYFTGIIGKRNRIHLNDDVEVERFRLYYASIDERDNVKITFRKMLCDCNVNIMNDFYKTIISSNSEYSTKYENLSIEVTVYGRFLMGTAMIFEVTKIEQYVPCTISKPIYLGDFEYDIFNILIDELELTKNDKRHKLYDDIKNMGSFYRNQYLIDLRSKIESDLPNREIIRFQLLYLNRIFDDIKNSCDGFKYNSVKLRRILEDVAMMHTSLHSEEFDQMGVLCDTNCLKAMYEAAMLISSLLLFDNEKIDNKQILIVLLVYFRKFYAIYLKIVKIPKKSISAYISYNKTVELMLITLGFDISKENYFYTEMQNFLLYIIKGM